MKKAKKMRVLSYAATKRKLDAEFNAMIRSRDADRRCISCGDRGPDQAGHFVPCGALATRWNPLNVNGQCEYCNGFLDGNQWQYGIGLDKKYGEGTAAKMMELSSHVGLKLKAYELQELRDAVKAGYEDYVLTYERLIAPKLGSLALEREP